MGALQRVAQRAREVSAASVPDVPSPCVSVCRMDPRTQLCEGCCRTLEEIAAWSRMQDDDKREVWRMISRRALEDTVIPAEAGIQSVQDAKALDPRLHGEDDRT